MSSLTSIRNRAERRVFDIISDVQDKVVARIVSSGSLRGFQGQAVRSAIKQEVQKGLHAAQGFVNTAVDEAWLHGIEKATIDMSKRMTVSPSSLTGERIYDFRETINSMYSRLFNDIETKLTERISRGSIRKLSPEDLVKEIGVRGGMFGGFRSRGMGIITEELYTVSSYAHQKRLSEIVEWGRLQTSATGKSPLKESKVGLKPMTMMIWMHSHLGSPPRFHHVAMEGKGVPLNKPFKIVNPKGEEFFALVPHDPALPPSETINCRCRAYPKTVWVTDEQKLEIEKQYEETGGFRDARWYKGADSIHKEAKPNLPYFKEQ